MDFPTGFASKTCAAGKLGSVTSSPSSPAPDFHPYLLSAVFGGGVSKIVTYNFGWGGGGGGSTIVTYNF